MLVKIKNFFRFRKLGTCFRQEAAAGLTTFLTMAYISFVQPAVLVRTFTSVVTAALFLLALFVGPLVAMVGKHSAITTPALVVVGSMMIRNVNKIDRADYSESIPAFLVILGIPLTYSIADGLALGFITYPLIKFLSGRRREINWLMYLIAAILIPYLVFIRAGN